MNTDSTAFITLLTNGTLCADSENTLLKPHHHTQDDNNNNNNNNNGGWN